MNGGTSAAANTKTTNGIGYAAEYTRLALQGLMGQRSSSAVPATGKNPGKGRVAGDAIAQHAASGRLVRKAVRNPTPALRMRHVSEFSLPCHPERPAMQLLAAHGAGLRRRRWSARGRAAPTGRVAGDQRLDAGFPQGPCLREGQAMRRGPLPDRLPVQPRLLVREALR